MVRVMGIRVRARGGRCNGEGGYHACPKIHGKRVVFQSKARYVRYVNRVSKSVKMGKKGYVFCFRALSRKKGRFENVPINWSFAGEKSILAHKMPKFSSSLALLARILL